MPSAQRRADLRRGRTVAAWLAIGGGLGAALGSVLPWITFQTVFGTIARNGFQLGNRLGFSPDGVVAVVFGCGMASAGIAALAGRRRALSDRPIGLSVAASALLAVEFAQDVGDLQGGGALVFGALGIGLYLVAVGVGAALVGNWWMWTIERPEAAALLRLRARRIRDFLSGGAV